jgi:hypothetical protein
VCSLDLCDVPEIDASHDSAQELPETLVCVGRSSVGRNASGTCDHRRYDSRAGNGAAKALPCSFASHEF